MDVAAFPLIPHLEAVNLLVAYRTLAHRVHQPGARIVISTDNSGSSFALQSGRTKDTTFANCSRELWLEALINNHIVVIRHKSGVDIPLADALSRQARDQTKADYVQRAISQRGITLISPFLKGYKFFSDSL